MEYSEEIYQQIILDHYKSPKSIGKLHQANSQAEGYDPTCGDKLTIFVQHITQRIEAISFIGSGCAISQASASIMIKQTQGLTKEEFELKKAELFALLISKDEDIDLFKYGDLAALASIRRFPARIKCVTLAWHTLSKALCPPPEKVVHDE